MWSGLQIKHLESLDNDKLHQSNNMVDLKKGAKGLQGVGFEPTRTLVQWNLSPSP